MNVILEFEERAADGVIQRWEFHGDTDTLEVYPASFQQGHEDVYVSKSMVPEHLAEELAAMNYTLVEK